VSPLSILLKKIPHYAPVDEKQHHEPEDGILFTLQRCVYCTEQSVRTRPNLGRHVNYIHY